MLANDTDDAVYDLESGRTDATLLRADVLAHMEERGIINASSFKVLGSVSVRGSARLLNVSILLQHVTCVLTPFAGSTARVSISGQHKPHTWKRLHSSSKGANHNKKSRSTSLVPVPTFLYLQLTCLRDIFLVFLLLNVHLLHRELCECV